MTDTAAQSAQEIQAKRMRARVLALERRVESLESLFLGALSLVTAVLLGLGSLLTIGVNPDSEVERWGVFSAPILLWGTLEDVENIPFTLFIVLLSVLHALAVLATVIFCASIARRDADPRLLVLAKTLAGIVALGVGVHLLLALAASSEDGGLGAGLYYLLPGLGLFALLTFRDSLQRLWVE